MNPSGKMRYYPGSPYCAEKTDARTGPAAAVRIAPADSKMLADNFRKLEAHAAAQGQHSTGRGKRS